MTLYQRKPAPPVEAVKWTGENADDIEAFVGSHHIDFTNPERTLLVWNEPEEQWLSVPLSNWVIKGVLGEFYPCAESVWEATYEPVEDGPEGPEDELEAHSAALSEPADDEDIGAYPDPFTRPEDLARPSKGVDA